MKFLVLIFVIFIGFSPLSVRADALLPIQHEYNKCLLFMLMYDIDKKLSSDDTITVLSEQELVSLCDDVKKAADSQMQSFGMKNRERRRFFSNSKKSALDVYRKMSRQVGLESE